MKSAVVIAKFPSGWRALAVGENTAELRAAFKAVKVAGSLVDRGEAAEVVLYFDTGGNIFRKFLRTPEAVAAIDAADEAGEEQKAAVEQAEADAAAKADGRAQAVAIAEKAVAVVAAEVGALVAGAVTLAAPAAPVAPIAPAVAPTPAPDAPTPSAPADSVASADGAGGEQTPDEEGDLSARFGGKGGKPAKPSKK